MSTVESSAKVFSFVVVLHVLASLISYLGFVESTMIESVSSYLAATVLGGFAFTYLLVSVSNGNGIP